MSEAAVAHVHIVWLGFEFTVPLDSDDANEDQPAQFLAVGSSVQLATVAPSSINVAALHQAVDVVFVPAELVAENRLKTASSQVLALPLCAKARHERSGVLIV